MVDRAEVIEGNHVWNYNTDSPALPGGFPYFPGGSKTVEPWLVLFCTIYVVILRMVSC